MNIVQIEINLQKLITTFTKKNFIYQLLLAYGLPKASITRLKKGNLNLAKVEGEISWKKKLFFREEYKEDLHLIISKIAKMVKHNERFVIVTDYKTRSIASKIKNYFISESARSCFQGFTYDILYNKVYFGYANR